MKEILNMAALGLTGLTFLAFRSASDNQATESSSSSPDQASSVPSAVGFFKNVVTMICYSMILQELTYRYPLLSRETWQMLRALFQSPKAE